MYLMMKAIGSYALLADLIPQGTSLIPCPGQVGKLELMSTVHVRQFLRFPG